MTISSHARAVVSESRVRLTRWILAHRIRARHPTLVCDPTAIWDYGYADIDAIEIGRDVTVAPFTEILVRRQTPRSRIPGGLVLGDGSVLATGMNVRAAGGIIRVGVNSGIGQHTVLVAANHAIDQAIDYVRADWNESKTGIEIGRNVWVGANCVVLPGSSIGDNAVIAAGSVVRDDVPAGELWGGVPARKIRTL